jgi:hypothetical protein
MSAQIHVGLQMPSGSLGEGCCAMQLDSTPVTATVAFVGKFDNVVCSVVRVL